MPLPPIELATVEELSIIAATATRGVHDHFGADDEDDDFDEDTHERDSARLGAAVSAARFCASLADHLGAVELCEPLVELLDAFPHLERVDGADVDAIAGAVGRLLQRGAMVTEGVASLARSSDLAVRVHVAKGIPPDDDFSVAILMELASDPAAEVRTAAHATLATRAALPWWHGKLSRDPTEGMAPEEQARHGDAIRRVAEILDLPSRQLAGGQEELARIADGLPRSIVVDLAESLLRSPERFRLGDQRLATMMLADCGGTEALRRTLARWEGRVESRLEGPTILADAVTALPEDRRREIVADLVKFALDATPGVRAEDGSAPQMAAEIVAAVWIPGDDTEPLLDALLAQEPLDDDEADCVVADLSRVLVHPPSAPDRLFQRALAARVASYPGAFEPLGGWLDVLLGFAPPALIREAAYGAMAHEDDATAQWALRQIVGRAHDPAVDPPVAQQIAALIELPRVRDLVCADAELCLVAIAPLRRLLRVRALPLPQSVQVMKAINTLWGGLTLSVLFTSRRTDARQHSADASRAVERSKRGEQLGPPELHGPPTEAEWSALRAARIRDPDPDVFDLVSALPKGPIWHPDDLAAMERAIARASPEDEHERMLIALGLSAKPSKESLRLLDDLVARFPRSRDVRLHRRLVAQAIGAAPGTPDEPEWMDEPEDD